MFLFFKKHEKSILKNDTERFVSKALKNENKEPLWNVEFYHEYLDVVDPTKNMIIVRWGPHFCKDHFV